ncbi:unnamed protein product, partial [Didymodactylos carnosus]
MMQYFVPIMVTLAIANAATSDTNSRLDITIFPSDDTALPSDSRFVMKLLNNHRRTLTKIGTRGELHSEQLSKAFQLKHSDKTRLRPTDFVPVDIVGNRNNKVLFTNDKENKIKLNGDKQVQVDLKSKS